MFREPRQNWDHNSLSADHTIARAHGGTRADRLLHSLCNKRRSDGTRDHLRPALTGAVDPPQEANSLLGHRAMPWPM